jgi:hypothetical protein
MARLVHIAETTFPKAGRSQEQDAVITALVVHDRCLVNFVAGDYGGNWHPNDVVLRTSWDAVVERRRRPGSCHEGPPPRPEPGGAAHLMGPARGPNDAVAVGYLIPEVNAALCEFTEVLVNLGSPGADDFVRARSVTHPLLPSKVFDRISYIEPAAPR